MSYTNREIGKIIREYRKKHRLTGGELGVKAGLSQSKLSKIETGSYIQLNHDEIKIILNILKVPAPILQQVLRSIDSEYPQETLRLFRYFSKNAILNETSAKIVRLYCGSILPSLVQTVAFRKAYVMLHSAEDELQYDLKMLMDRQDMIWEDNRKYIILMPQTVLYMVFTGKDTHLAQLDRLERLITGSPLKIGILPLEVGTAPADYGSFAIYDETAAVSAMVTGEVKSTNKQDIDAHLYVFERLQRMACYDDEAIALIRQAASTLI